VRSEQGLTQVKACAAVPPGFIFVKLNDAGPDFDEYSATRCPPIDNMADRCRGRARDRRRVPALHAPVQLEDVHRELNDTMHPMVAHESSAAPEDDVAGKPADEPKPMDRAVRAVHVGLQVLRGHGVRVFDNGHSFSACTTASTASIRVPEYTRHEGAYGDERAAQILGLARHNTVYYPNLTIKGAIQSIRVVKPIARTRR